MQQTAGIQVPLRGKWARISLPVTKSLFKATKLCIQVGKPQFNLLWAYANVPPLVGQNIGEMEGRNRRKMCFFNITFQFALRLFFQYPIP